ncbi:phage tail protein [Roseivirga sp.]|uniref:phage tail protein n=1 Tax=Roseivirga sp. TaxID=1964215 RepID=UPI003B8D73B2
MKEVSISVLLPSSSIYSVVKQFEKGLKSELAGLKDIQVEFIAQRSGLENNHLSILTMPSHTHSASLTGAQITVPVQSASVEEDEANPAAGVLTNTGTDNFTSSGGNAAYNGGAGTQVAGTVSVQATGNGLAYNNMQPYLGVNFIIALFGIYPSRNWFSHVARDIYSWPLFDFITTY